MAPTRSGQLPTPTASAATTAPSVPTPYPVDSDHRRPRRVAIRPNGNAMSAAPSRVVACASPANASDSASRSVATPLVVTPMATPTPERIWVTTSTTRIRRSAGTAPPSSPPSENP